MRNLPSALVLFLTLFASSHLKAESTSTAWERAAAHAGVDPLLLYAIALTESGKRGPSGKGVVAWPWTLNTPTNKGEYFPTLKEAKRALENYLGRGLTNIDIGLGQVNWRWNGQRLVSDATRLLDPETNIYAMARVLADEIAENPGNLWHAVGSYHNPRNPRRDRYARKVRLTYEALLKHNPYMLRSLPWTAPRISKSR